MRNLLSFILAYALIINYVIYGKVAVVNKRTVVKKFSPDDLIIPPQGNEIEPDTLLYYNSDDGSPENTAHGNRVYTCEDHSSAKNICIRAFNSCFCQEHEAYAYSFCRKSCRYCSVTDSEPKSVWRVVAGSSFKPTWMIKTIKFYSDYPDVESVLNITHAFSSSSYPGYTPLNAFDNNSNTIWMPSEWGYHEPNTTWIGMNFSQPARFNAIMIEADNLGNGSLPKYLHIESADQFEGPFTFRWTVHMNRFHSNGIAYKPVCPVLWQKFTSDENNYCIRLIAKHLNWDQARSQCHHFNSELVSIQSKDEERFILEQVGICGHTWIGYNDKRTEGEFEWSDKSNSNYTNWLPGELNDEERQNEEDCVIIDTKGEWLTAPCHNTHFFLCKKVVDDYQEPNPDNQAPDLNAPVIFLPHNFDEGFINNSHTNYEKENMILTWPLLKNIPINVNATDMIGNADVLPSAPVMQNHTIMSQSKPHQTKNNNLNTKNVTSIPDKKSSTTQDTNIKNRQKNSFNHGKILKKHKTNK